MYIYLRNHANHSQYRHLRASSDNLPRGISFLHFGRPWLLHGSTIVPMGVFSLYSLLFCKFIWYLSW
ncbi:hypothetical protein KVT40_006001 [Elsinoe batatas]|uniref:Uncharacterized protein n=1 Tax=Elsinoe batatas TaxID=2601811 RepID=A0A8K0L185_9PEZI|nr:hypothetical protein KVT40_006001 [Elsinoe batatas]